MLAVDVWIWVALALVAAAPIVGVWWKRRARRVYVIDHVRVEMHPACVVEDRVIEQVWRAAILLTNTSRRPRALPTFAERATVRAGRREYLATVYLDADEVEVNPREVSLAWVESVLPADVVPSLTRAVLLRQRRTPRVLRYAPARASGATQRSRLKRSTAPLRLG